MFLIILVLRLPRLGKRELILVLFIRLFVCLICACLDLSVSSSSWGLGVWEGLRFVTVALPGLFSYLCFLTSGLGLDDMSLAWPAVVQLLVFFYSGIQ